MRIFFDDRQLLHAPLREMHNGDWSNYAEVRGRASSILQVLGPVEVPSDFGETPLAAVHTSEYLEFLQTAVPRWRAAGGAGDAIGYVWPVVGRRPLKFSRIDAELGQYSMDASTPLTEETWNAAMILNQCGPYHFRVRDRRYGNDELYRKTMSRGAAMGVVAFLNDQYGLKSDRSRPSAPGPKPATGDKAT